MFICSLSSTGDTSSSIRAHSGNIQGTFREHSGNIQGTFREHSGNMQGAYREHSGNIYFELGWGLTGVELRWKPMSPHPNCRKHSKERTKVDAEHNYPFMGTYDEG
jgi:hypothetical protein